MKHGSAMNINTVCVLAGLGLVYSFWTQSILVRILDFRDRNEDFQITFLNTYIIVYFTTAVGLIRGFYISEFRYFKLWGFVKIVELILNILNVIAGLSDLMYGYHYSRSRYIPVVFIVSAFGIIVMMKVLKLYKNLLAESEDTSKEEKNVLPPYNITTNIPSVHKTTDISV